MKHLSVIIDTDPGVDDALAIMFAIKAGLPVEALLSVYGNVALEKTTRNAHIILDILKRSDIPVFSGAEKPLAKSIRLAECHGESGLGGLEYHKEFPVSPKKAEVFLQETLSQKKCDILCLGPLTNLALFLKNNAELRTNIHSLIMMGGVFGEAGNVSPYAEFNIYNDPEALAEILDYDIPKVLIPANVCRKVRVTKLEFDKVLEGGLFEEIKQILTIYIDYYYNDPYYKATNPGCVIYDLLVSQYVLYPELFKTETVHVEVDLSDSETRGKTTVNTELTPNCRLVYDVDAERSKELFLQTCFTSKLDSMSEVVTGEIPAR